MNMLFRNLTETDGELFSALRKSYRNSLPEPQELFLEMKVRDSGTRLIQIEGDSVGYCCFSQERELTEFYLEPEFLPHAGKVFDGIIRELKLHSIWCKSFDRLCLSLCMERKLPHEVVGFHFRQRLEREEVILPEGMKVRPATTADIDLIMEKDDSYFESREEAEMIVAEELLLYFHKGGELYACGTIMHLFKDSNVYDIGMLVVPEYRKNGLGTIIISYLADYCKRLGWRPNAGCAVDNIASRKTLEKAGFVKKDCLLLFGVEVV